MVRIRWLESARNDLKDIYDFIALDSTRYAKFQIERIQERTELLRKQPNAGRVVPELDIESVKELIEGNYRIIYKIHQKDFIEILMVHHSARDLTKRKL